MSRSPALRPSRPWRWRTRSRSTSWVYRPARLLARDGDAPALDVELTHRAATSGHTAAAAGRPQRVRPVERKDGHAQPAARHVRYPGRLLRSVRRRPAVATSRTTRARVGRHLRRHPGGVEQLDHRHRGRARDDHRDLGREQPRLLFAELQSLGLAPARSLLPATTLLRRLRRAFHYGASMSVSPPRHGS